MTTYYKNGKLLAKAFLEGKADGRIGTETRHGNLKVIGNQLLHYETPTLEWLENGDFILNVTRYSQVTGLIQKWLKKETLQDIPYKEAHKVETGYKGTLADFVTK